MPTSDTKQPNFPVYIISKGRWQSRYTSRALEMMGVPYRIVVEEQEREAYAAVVDPTKVLILDPAYQRNYDPLIDLDSSKSKGSGPARNFVWDHAIASGASRHWLMDDNIDRFFRFNRNLKTPVGDGTILRCMEDFVLRYVNVPLAGPQYFKFVTRKERLPPFVLNTRIYSCLLIRNDLPFRWRGRYNEDVDFSLRILKAGWCTIQFNAFLQDKKTTQVLKGGNTDAFYAEEGTLPKSRMIVDLHPDVARLAWRFGRWHHYVDYSSFKANQLIRRPGLEVSEGSDDYGMRLYVDAVKPGLHRAL